MSISNLEAEIRGFTTADIRWHLKENQDHFDGSGLFFLCDELLRRGEKITGLSTRFEALTRKLPTRILRYVDTYDYQFSKAAVHVALKEMQRRGKSVSRWLLKIAGVESGPMNRLELENRIKEVSAGHVWKEGMAEWKSINDMPHLTEPLFYDQEFDENQSGQREAPRQEQSQPRHKPADLASSSESASSSVIAAGVLTFITFPIWAFGIIAVAFSDLTSIFGPLLPVAFASFMLIMSIPLGIGLMMRKKWAWSMKIATSGIVAAWFVANTFLGDTHFVGLTFALFEIIILILLLVAKDEF